MFMTLFISACTIAANTVYPAAQVNLPFQAGVKDSVVETQFRALTTKSYTFYLDLHFREGDGQDRNRVSTIAGTGQRDRTGQDVNRGLPIPVRLSVGRVGAEAEWSVLDNVFVNHRLEGYSADNYSKIIAGALLEPGTYRVRVEALQDIPELDDVPVSFDVHVRPR
jgi:hypothetical protein